MLVLTWNLYHGRAVPPAGRDLLDEFAAALAGWDWDVALLQEVPPWWPAPLGRATGAHARMALTSRNVGYALRRALARRWPDLMRSGGGGANAILVRGGAVAEHRIRRLRWRPERRVVHAVRLEDGTWVANLHAQGWARPRSQADIEQAARHVLEWAGAAPVVLGGDLNLFEPDVPGFSRAGHHRVDHVWARGLAPAGSGRVLEHGSLSDHAPLLVDVRREGSMGD